LSSENEIDIPSIRKFKNRIAYIHDKLQKNPEKLGSLNPLIASTLFSPLPEKALRINAKYG
jgi:hypothetical protein